MFGGVLLHLEIKFKAPIAWTGQDADGTFCYNACICRPTVMHKDGFVDMLCVAPRLRSVLVASAVVLIGTLVLSSCQDKLQEGWDQPWQRELQHYPAGTQWVALLKAASSGSGLAAANQPSVPLQPFMGSALSSPLAALQASPLWAKAVEGWSFGRTPQGQAVHVTFRRGQVVPWQRWLKQNGWQPSDGGSVPKSWRVYHHPQHAAVAWLQQDRSAWLIAQGSPLQQWPEWLISPQSSPEKEPTLAAMLHRTRGLNAQLPNQVPLVLVGRMPTELLPPVLKRWPLLKAFPLWLAYPELADSASTPLSSQALRVGPWTVWLPVSVPPSEPWPLTSPATQTLLAGAPASPTHTPSASSGALAAVDTAFSKETTCQPVVRAYGMDRLAAYWLTQGSSSWQQQVLLVAEQVLPLYQLNLRTDLFGLVQPVITARLPVQPTASGNWGGLSNTVWSTPTSPAKQQTLVKLVQLAQQFPAQALQLEPWQGGDPLRPGEGWRLALNAPQLKGTWLLYTQQGQLWFGPTHRLPGLATAQRTTTPNNKQVANPTSPTTAEHPLGWQAQLPAAWWQPFLAQAGLAHHWSPPPQTGCLQATLGWQPQANAFLGHWQLTPDVLPALQPTTPPDLQSPAGSADFQELPPSNHNVVPTSPH